jgi:hypothetical protein
LRPDTNNAENNSGQLLLQQVLEEDKGFLISLEILIEVGSYEGLQMRGVVDEPGYDIHGIAWRDVVLGATEEDPMPNVCY